MECESCNARTLHLVIGDALSFVAEIGYFLIDIFHSEPHTQYASLWTVETIRCDSTTAHHIIAGDTLHQFRVRCHHIRNGSLGGITNKINECLLKTHIGYLISIFVESQYTVPTDRFLAHKECTKRNIFLHTSASTHAHDVEHTRSLFLCAGSEINIRQRIYLVHDDVAVVRTDTCGYTGDAFTLKAPCYRMELTRLYIAFDGTLVKEGCHKIHSTLVTNQDNLICQMFWLDMQMED